MGDRPKRDRKRPDFFNPVPLPPPPPPPGPNLERIEWNLKILKFFVNELKEMTQKNITVADVRPSSKFVLSQETERKYSIMIRPAPYPDACANDILNYKKNVLYEIMSKHEGKGYDDAILNLINEYVGIRYDTLRDVFAELEAHTIEDLQMPTPYEVSCN